MVQWNNNPISLEYLNKVQKARTFEFWKFFIEINDKYKLGLSLSPSISLSLWLLLQSSSWYMLKESVLLVLSQIEKDKYFKLFNRVIDAKIAYEKSGGKYK